MPFTYEDMVKQTEAALRQPELNALISKVNAASSVAVIAVLLAEFIAAADVMAATVGRIKVLTPDD